VITPAKIGHLGLTVPDLDAAVKWYTDTLAWTLLMGPVEVSVENPKVAEQIRDVFKADNVVFRQAHLLAADDLAVELFEFRQPHATLDKGDFAFWRTGVFHICIVEPDIDELAARISASGGARRTPTRPIFPGEPYLFCYCEDPFGNVLEIASHPHAEAFGGRTAY
jgi:catechol 2,3-dioxygenase-like lactoylglutathione lyase family enzyme